MFIETIAWMQDLIWSTEGYNQIKRLIWTDIYFYVLYSGLSYNLNHIKNKKDLTINLGKSKRLTSFIRIIVASPQKVYLMKILSVLCNALQQNTIYCHMTHSSRLVNGSGKEELFVKITDICKFVTSHTVSFN